MHHNSTLFSIDLTKTITHCITVQDENSMRRATGVFYTQVVRMDTIEVACLKIHVYRS